MLGIPEDPNVGKVLRWAKDKDLYTITLCHGPGALLSTNLDIMFSVSSKSASV